MLMLKQTSSGKLLHTTRTAQRKINRILTYSTRRVLYTHQLVLWITPVFTYKNDLCLFLDEILIEFRFRFRSATGGKSTFVEIFKLKVSHVLQNPTTNAPSLMEKFKSMTSISRLTTSRMSLDPDPPWDKLPDDILLQIFCHFSFRSLATAAQVCLSWQRVAMDELLWKQAFRRHYSQPVGVTLAPGRTSWREEFARLYSRSPAVHVQTLTSHTNQVLHVSFSHDGRMFATSSKDGFIKVWNSGHPATLRHERSMVEFSWQYTQFSQFNHSDTLLLVSGVYFGSTSTAGEVAIFSLKDSDTFELQCRVRNKPYDVFGTWYSERYLLSGNLKWLEVVNGQDICSCSMISLNYAFQATESEEHSVVCRLFRFKNVNSSTIRTIMVANPAKNRLTNPTCAIETETKTCDNESGACGDTNADSNVKTPEKRRNSNEKLTLTEKRRNSSSSSSGQGLYPLEKRRNSKTDKSPEKRKSPAKKKTPEESEKNEIPNEVPSERLLIFTKGEKTYSPHVIGIKRLPEYLWAEKSGMRAPPNVDFANYRDLRDSEFDQVDYRFDMNGHIIGMGLSPDHRYLFANIRAWPRGAQITDTHRPPPIAQEIDIHVIDLHSMARTQQVYRSHRAFTPDEECFFIFLDVSEDYIASGAEDKQAYVWERHYGHLLAKFPHHDVVNSVAFSPTDQEYLVTVSDDFTVKIWTSRHRKKICGIAVESEDLFCEEAMDVSTEDEDVRRDVDEVLAEAGQ